MVFQLPVMQTHARFLIVLYYLIILNVIRKLARQKNAFDDGKNLHVRGACVCTDNNKVNV